MKLTAFVLFGLAVISFVYQGITVTTKKKVVDAGPIQITRSDKDTIPLPPVAGAIFLIGGVACLFIAEKRA